MSEIDCPNNKGNGCPNIKIAYLAVIAIEVGLMS